MGGSRGAEPERIRDDTDPGREQAPLPGQTGMTRLREAIQAENSAAGPERRQRTSELRFMDSPEADRVSADMPGNTETAGEPEEKPAPGRIRPGWDTAAVVRAQEEAEGAASPYRTAPGRLQYAETPGTDSVPDYLGEIGRYDAGESSH